MSKRYPLTRQSLAAALIATGCVAAHAQSVISYLYAYSGTVPTAVLSAPQSFAGQVATGVDGLFQSGQLTVNYADDNDPWVDTGTKTWVKVFAAGGPNDGTGVRLVSGDVALQEHYTYHDRYLGNAIETAQLSVGGQTVTVSSTEHYTATVNTATQMNGQTIDRVLQDDGGYITYITRYWDQYRDIYSGYQGTMSASITLSRGDLDTLSATGKLGYTIKATDGDFKVDSVLLSANWEAKPIVLPDPDPGTIIVTPGVPEPDSLALAAAGLAVAGWTWRRRSKAQPGVHA